MGADPVVANAEVMFYALLVVMVVAGVVAVIVLGLRQRRGASARGTRRRGHGRAP